MKMNVFDLLKLRGYIYQTSSDKAIREFLSKPAVLYHGYDPTADSFHAGVILPFTAYHYLLAAGHKIIFLIGGGTGLIGDPTGKMEARPLLSESQVKANLESLEKQAKKLLGPESNIIFVNNADWLTKASLFEFLRKITPHISVNQLLKHETYKRRLEDNLNLSLLELLYSSLQAWDFLYLFENYGCRLQFGSQDQWRNMLDGVELIRKIKGEEAYAMTHPLLTTKSGKKMGKSERGTVWLDPQKTLPFEFYQYWLNRPDEELERDLKLFTLLELEEVDAIMKQPPKKIQERLAFEVTKFVHGEREAVKAARGENVPVLKIKVSDNVKVSDSVAKAKLVPSKSEARRLIKQGAISLNGEKITDIERVYKENDFGSGDELTVRVGKNRFLKVAKRD